MFTRHKDRLYLTLEKQRHGIPGYVWSIVLAPADEKYSGEDSETLNAIKWGVVESAPCNWSLSQEKINLDSARMVVARLLVAKFVTSEETESRISEILNEIPVEQDDPDFRSRVWAVEAMEALRVAGLAQYDVTRSQLEKQASTLANESMLKLSRRTLVISKATDIPTEDVRWK